MIEMKKRVTRTPAVLALAAILSTANAQERVRPPPVPKSCSPSIGNLFSTATPEANFLSPSVSPSGEQTFRFTHDWRNSTLKAICWPDLSETERESYINTIIGGHLAKLQWCLHGWEIISRKILELPPPVLVVEGRCIDSAKVERDKP